jgi:hypothetical protein
MNPLIMQFCLVSYYLKLLGPYVLLSTLLVCPCFSFNVKGQTDIHTKLVEKIAVF